MSDDGQGSDTAPTRLLPLTENWTGAEPSMFSGRAPKQIGEYQLLRMIGGGGMGVVFEARHIHLKRPVAIKLIPQRFLTDATASRRFFREMEAAGRLDHPHIVRATDAGVCDGVPYLVMELIRGLDLARVVSRYGPLPPLAAVEAIEQVAQALSYIHGLGMIHRDIKPSNLLFDDQALIKVTDLGLVHSLESSSETDEITVSGDIIGTVDYMAPEQGQNPRLADHRADIYSLGCCMHYLLTGAPVYEADSRVDRLIAHRSSKPPDLASGCTAPLPDSASRLFEEMLAKDPLHRSETIDDVLVQLRSTAAEIRTAAERSEQTFEFGKRSLPADAGLRDVAEIVFADRQEEPIPFMQPATLLHTPPQPVSPRRWLTIGPAMLAILAAVVGYGYFTRPEQPQASVEGEEIVGDPVDDQTPVAPAPTVLRGHVGAVFNVHFTGDGEHLVSCGSDGTIRVWDLSTKTQQGLMAHDRGPQGQHVIDVALVPDSSLAVSVCYSGIATVWDWQTSQLQRSFTGHLNRVEGVASLGGTNVLTTGMDDAICIWDAQDAHLIHRLENDHQGGIRAVAVETAGHRAVTGDYEGNLFLWDLDHIEQFLPERVTVTSEPVNVWCADWVPGTDLICIGGVLLSGDPLLLTYNVSTQQVDQQFVGHQRTVKGVRASRDGRRLYSAAENVRGWLIETATPCVEFNEHSDEVFSVDESPDGQRLASGGTDGTIRVMTLSALP